MTLATRWRQDARTMLAELVADEAPQREAEALLMELTVTCQLVAALTEQMMNMADEAARNARRLGWRSHFSRGRRALELQQEGLLADADRISAQARVELGLLGSLRGRLQDQLHRLRQHGTDMQLRCDIAATLVADSLASRRIVEQLGDADWPLLLERLDDLRQAEAALRLTAAQCSAAEAETGSLVDRHEDVQAVLSPLLQERVAARKAA